MKYRRVSLSFNIEQMLWLEQLFVLLRKGSDVKVMLRTETGARASTIVYQAGRRARGLAEKLPPKEPLTHCRNGHPYTPENTTRHADGWRRCRTCQKSQRQKSAEKAKERKRLAEQGEAAE